MGVNIEDGAKWQTEMCTYMRCGSGAAATTPLRMMACACARAAARSAPSTPRAIARSNAGSFTTRRFQFVVVLRRLSE